MSTSVDGDSFEEQELLNLTGGPANSVSELLVADTDTKKVLVPTSDIGQTWKTVGFDDSAWTTGTKGAGYERSSGNTYDPFFGPTLEFESQLYDKTGTLYMRVPFNVADKDAYTGLVLCVRYDDGFVAYLNGTEVASRNSPGGTPAWNAEATATHDDNLAVVFDPINIDEHMDKLVDGDNILAIHGLNSPKTSSDMLTGVELKGILTGGGGGGGGEPENLNDIGGPIDGAFHTFVYPIEDSAQTVHMKWTLSCNQGDAAIILDNILVKGTPLKVQDYSSWVQLTTGTPPYLVDDQGAPNFDAEGDTIENLLEYAFGGSAVESDSGILPTMEVKEVDGVLRFVMNWRQINENISGSLGDFPGNPDLSGGYKVRDIKYVPEVSFDGINWFGGGRTQYWVPIGSDGSEMSEGEVPEGDGEFLEVSAFWNDIDNNLANETRVFGRVRIELDTQ